MATEHNTITDPEIHEPKGASSASAGQVYISDGAGSGDWRYTPHSAFYYDDIGTGTTFTAPVAYTLIDPVTIGDADPHDFTHNTAGRLTYTGTDTMDVTVSASITVKHSSATLVDVFFQFHVNGVAVVGAQQATAALAGNYTHVSLNAHMELTATDYVELYGKTASGDIVIHAIAMIIHGHP